jgi:23S rRNA (uracil1939-C5)-methyltransferase
MATRAQICPHRPPCPGCPRLFEPGYPEPARALLTQLARRAGISPPTLHEGGARGFRVRARLAVRGRSASPKIGIFQSESHRIVDIPNCLVHHPLINRVGQAVKRGIRKTGTRPYAEGPHLGELRGIQVVVERSSQSAQVVLIGNDSDSAALAPLAAELEGDLGSELHSLWWNGNPDRSNVILGPHWQKYNGPDYVVEDIAGAKICFPPGAFAQSNLDLAGRMVERIAEWAPDGSRIAEFYAGCGSIGLGLASRSERIVFNEVGDDSLAGLALGLARLPLDVRARTEVVAGDAGEQRHAIGGASVVIADPPRKGLDPEFLDAIRDSPPSRFIYVSCGLDSFLRDSARLLDGGRMQLRKLESYGLFRYSDHVENLALFVSDDD